MCTTAMLGFNAALPGDSRTPRAPQRPGDGFAHPSWLDPRQAPVVPQSIEEPAAEADGSEVDEDGTEESPGMEIDKKAGQEERTVVLKLVFPTGTGVEKELNVDNFSINVNPEAGADNSGERSVKDKRAKRKKS